MQYLQDGAMAIFGVCFQYGIKLEMEWIPIAQNQLADYISRIQDCDDWMVDPNLFTLWTWPGGHIQWTVLHRHTIVSLHGFTVNSSVQVQRLWILSQ